MATSTKKQPVASSSRRSRTEVEPARAFVQPRSRAEQYAAGKALRETSPRDAHADWKSPADRRGAVDTVLAAEAGRMPELLPLRHGRMVRSAFTFYRGSALAGWCGRALALSHARSGSSAMLSGYMGKSDVFDKAIAAFSLAYADQNESDHAALARAVRSGKVPAVFEETR